MKDELISTLIPDHYIIGIINNDLSNKKIIVIKNEAKGDLLDVAKEKCVETNYLIVTQKEALEKGLINIQPYSKALKVTPYYSDNIDLDRKPLSGKEQRRLKRKNDRKAKKNIR
ncbi:hypothetical protein MYP_4769 [Sporocytophaga myxococcoides]|uniref:Uncharacterized protein n=1 Tax=Sporocytophaga myxococcoides TaxID=153721 RepID=A0A098LM19_9BACT|nr:hypothetical protein [Sporocytophaga myxococcoides]GAL87539.1 hypothetical protein MYP_4769 [Sporocytophaga myxococcoides]